MGNWYYDKGRVYRVDSDKPGRVLSSMSSVELRRYWAKIDDYRSLLKEDPDRDPSERKFKEYSRECKSLLSDGSVDPEGKKGGKEICIEIVKDGLPELLG